MDNTAKVLEESQILKEKTVDIRKEIYENAEVTYQKPKVLNIKVDEDFIENNLIDMPFIYYYQNKSKEEEIITVVKYSWNDNNGLERCIEVRSSIHGVPSPFEYDLLIALLRIFVRQNNNKIIIPNQKDYKNIVHFTFRELSKEMGYSGFGSTTKKRLEKGIERLCDTNIYNTSLGGLYNSITQEYILDAKKQIGILYEYQSYSYISTKDGKFKLDKDSLKDKASVVIDDFFFKSLCNGKGKISNRNLRLSFKNDVARRLYLILNKWRNNRGELFLTYGKMYERIPLNASKSIAYRNKRIRTATTELVDNGFLKEFIQQTKGLTFVFNEESKSIKRKSSNTTGILGKYLVFNELMEGFKKYGLTDKEITEHFKLYQTPYAQALLRYIDIHLNKIDDCRVYLLGGLNKEYPIDKMYYNS